MVELKRIYWSRQALRGALLAVTIWLFVAAISAVMPKASGDTVPGPASGIGVVRTLGKMGSIWGCSRLILLFKVAGWAGRCAPRHRTPQVADCYEGAQGIPR